MGAWYVFASIGLYPEIPGFGLFSVNTPIFTAIRIHLKHGDLTIAGGSDRNYFIDSMKFNGKYYHKTWFNWDDISKGGTIQYQVSDKPNTKWGANVVPPSF